MIRIFFNPLDSKSVAEYPITPGTQLIQFLQSNYPTGFDGALRVFIGIEELDLIDLDYEVQETDNITMLVMPSADPATWGAVGAILINAAVSFAIGYVINLIFAPKTPSFGDDQAESVVYTLSPTRNEARLGQPIASHYGTVSHPPAYASAPYVFYWDGSNDQYVDELLCLGQGKFEIQDIYIGDTPIGAIQPGTVKYWVFDADDHQQQVGRIGDTITAEVENTETPWPFHENVFTSPEVEDFAFSQEQNEENSTPVAISGDAYAAGIDPITGLYLLGRIEGVDDTLLISGGDTIELAGTTSNNIKFVVGSVAPTPNQAGKMTLFQQWGWDGPYIADELGLSGTFTINVLVDGMTGGPFRVQKVGATVNKIDCDIVFPQGLFRVDGTSGNIKTFSVELEFTYQEIDETTGSPIGSPVVQNKTWTSKSRIPLRATVSSGILPDGAYECSVRRVNPVSEDSRITDLVTWIGLKGYVTLDRNAEAYGKVSLIAFRLKASNGIAAAARSRIRVVAKRILTTGQSDNPITVVKDIWANSDYGLGFPLSLLDPAMDNLETLWGDAQGPKFNGSYDQKSTGFDAMQSCVSMAGAKVVSDGQLTNVVPERIQQVRHAMFSTANIVRDSLEIIYTFDADGDFTGNVLEYRDPSTFEAKYVYSPEETANPEAFTLFGCTDEDYAQEMANYLWNIKTLRRKAVRFDTELEGLIPKFGQRIGISHTMPDWGQSGVFVYNIDALTWMVDQPLDWTEDNIIIIRSDTGLPSSPYTVTQGVNPNIVVFAEVPSIKNQQGQEPTSYAFGTATNIITDFIVTKVAPKGDNIVQIEGQLYNEEVYVDVPWQMNPDQIPCKQYECDAFGNELINTFTNAWVMDDLSGDAVALTGGVDLSPFGAPTYQTNTTFIDGCSNDFGVAINGTNGFRKDNNTFITSLNGSIATYYGVSSSNDLRVVDVEFSSSRQVSLVAGGNSVDFQIQGGGGTFVVPFPGGGGGTNAYYIMAWTLDTAGDYVADLWVDFGYRGQVSGNAGAFIAPSGPDIRVGSTSGTGVGVVQYVAYSPTVVGQSEVDALKLAYDQNQSTYVDPDPNCIQPTCKQYECDAYETALAGLSPQSWWKMLSLTETDTGDLLNGSRLTDFGSANNDLFIDANGGTYYTVPSIVPDACEGALAFAINAGNGTGFRMGQVAQPYPTLASTGEGVIGGIVKRGTITGTAVMYAGWRFAGQAGANAIIDIKTITTNSVELFLQTTEFTDGGAWVQVHQGSQTVTVPNISGVMNVQASWVTTGSGSTASTTATIYADWDLSNPLGSVTLDGDLNSGPLDSGAELFMMGSYMIENHAFILSTVPAGGAWDGMADAWLQNQVGYVDPNPACIPICKQYECNAYEQGMLLAGLQSYYPFTQGADGTNMPGTTLIVAGQLHTDMGSQSNDLYTDQRGAPGWIQWSDSVVPDECPGGTSLLSVDSNGAGLKNYYDSVYGPAPVWDAGFNGTGVIGGIVKNEAAGVSGTLVRLEFQNDGSAFPGIDEPWGQLSDISLASATDAGDVTLRVNVIDWSGYPGDANGTKRTQDLVVSLPTFGTSTMNVQAKWVTVNNITTVDVYSEWDFNNSLGQIVLTGELNSGFQNFATQLLVQSGSLWCEHVFAHPSALSSATVDSLADDWARNKSDYVDPDPTCIEP